jgi:uncharacterized RDD family membrane protein YckC
MAQELQLKNQNMTAEQNKFPSEDSSEIKYAGFWIRVVAMIIDSLVFLVPGYFIDRFSGDYATAVYLVAWCFYEAFFLASSWQATIGKRVMGIKVVGEDGEKISIGRAIGRTVAQFFSVIIICIGYFMVGWNKKKRGLHDMIAATYVIKA